jgi:hypothetical protein
MRRGAYHSPKGTIMIREEKFQPNGRALRGILAALITAAVFTCGVTISLALRPLPLTPVRAPKPPSALPMPSGVWKGSAALMDRGICDLRLEIAAEEPGRFNGFSSFSCTTAEPLMSKAHRPDLRAEALNLNPNAAVLTGTLQNGVIQFHAIHSIGADIYACAVPAFIVTQFGSDRLAAEWKDCGGGAVIMQRAKS